LLFFERKSGSAYSLHVATTTEGADKTKQVTLIQQQAEQVTLIHLRSRARDMSS
jgi:hypothetical protein